MYALIFQRLLLEGFLDIFYFPLWWYTKGLTHAGGWCFDLLKFGNQRLAPGLWLANIFVPMFGQFDFQGRIISFLMRSTQIIFRTTTLTFWLIFCFILFAIWIALPIAAGAGIYYSFKN